MYKTPFCKSSHILCLRCEDAKRAILCTGLHITTTIAGEWLNSLIFHNNNKCITPNEQMMIDSAFLSVV